MRKTYTKTQKAEYFKSLRQRWQAAKKISDNGGAAEFQAIIENHGLNISMTGFILVSQQMKALGMDGLPYLDAKTFRGWKENGFKVRKGEKSNLSGITWIGVKPKNEDDENKTGYAMPKAYHLFHRSQVDPV
jgi:hypothetical protein